jgi:hypothetical protein
MDFSKTVNLPALCDVSQVIDLRLRYKFVLPSKTEIRLSPRRIIEQSKGLYHPASIYIAPPWTRN